MTKLSRSAFSRTHEYQVSGRDFGILRIEIKKSRNTDSRGYRGSQFQSTTTKTRYCIYPSFLFWAVEVMTCHSGMSSSRISLKTMPRISQEMRRSMCRYVVNGDVAGFQSLLGTGKISIHSEHLFGVSQRVVCCNHLLTDSQSTSSAVRHFSEHETDILLFLIHQGCRLDISVLSWLLSVLAKL